jgi:LEA14-like dessication related protein
MKRPFTLAWLLAGLCIVVGIVAISVAGCSSLANLDIINPRYSLREVTPRVQLAIPPSMDFDLTVGVDNPNPVSLRLDRLDFDLFVNNNHLLNSISNQGVKIPARGIGDIHLTAHVGYNEIKSIFREVADVVQGRRAQYEIRGNAYYNTPVGQMRFPVTVVSSSQ